MAGTKRGSMEENTEAPLSKVAKTTKGRSKGTGKSKAIPYPRFQAQALPIHVSLTHTPAAVIEDEEEPTTSSDPGHITTVTLLPSEFSTGSYGWKGNSRIQVELQGADSEGNEKEKVTVMLNINATVLGSKRAKHETKSDEEESDEDEDDDERKKD